MSLYSVLDFGAVGDGVTLDTVAIQAAIDRCSQAGGGRVLLPAGKTYLAGSFELKSYVDFHLEMGSVLKSDACEENFPLFAFTTGAEAGKRLWIGGKHLTQVSITGGGIIDGNCHAFSLEEGPYIHTRTLAWRPAMTCFEDCRHFTVRDVTLRNAANWTLHFSGCEDVVVDGVRIYNDLKFPNCDGIDPDHCRNVRISNCHIEAGDDCIVLKNTAPFAKYGPTENITVSNCTLISTSSAIKIGTESVDDFRNLVFTNCVIQKSNRGLSIQLRDGGTVENVVFSNMTIETRRFHDMWWGAAEAIYVTALPRNAETEVGQIRHVVFSNILCRGENGIFLYGSEPDRIQNVRFDGVQLTLCSESRWPAGRYDLRPCEPGRQPLDGIPRGEQTPWGVKTERKTPAIYLENAQEVTLHQCQVDHVVGLPESYSGVLEQHGVEGLAVEQIKQGDTK